MGFATNKLLACVVLAVCIGGSVSVRAQDAQKAPDTLHLKSGEKIPGTVMNILPDGSIQFKFDKGTLPYPKQTIQKVVLGERPELKQAQTAAQAGNNEEVIKLLTPVVDKYLGYQNPWVVQAAVTLANSLAQSGKTFKAVELGKRITALDPDSDFALVGIILEANTLVSRNKADEALTKLDSIKEKLPVKTSPDLNEMQLLGDYHMARAGALEQKNEPAEALENYLTVVAVYPNPQSRAKQAQQKANALLKKNSELMVP